MALHVSGASYVGSNSLSEVGAAADAASRRARERYNSSVLELRSALERLKSLQPQLSTHEQRLNSVEQRVKGLRQEIGEYAKESRTRQTATANPLLTIRTVADSDARTCTASTLSIFSPDAEAALVPAARPVAAPAAPETCAQRDDDAEQVVPLEEQAQQSDPKRTLRFDMPLQDEDDEGNDDDESDEEVALAETGKREQVRRELRRQATPYVVPSAEDSDDEEEDGEEDISLGERSVRFEAAVDPVTSDVSAVTAPHNEEEEISKDIRRKELRRQATPFVPPSSVEDEDEDTDADNYDAVEKEEEEDEDEKERELPESRENELDDEEAQAETAPAPVAQCPSVMTSALASGPSNKPRISWAPSELQAQQVCHYSVHEFSHNVPEHGHWLPEELRQRRPSFEESSDLAKRLNGRMVRYRYDEDDPDELVECVLVEPMGKILSPTEYGSTGLVICVLEAEDPEQMQEEWDLALKRTAWLDAGLSVALPNLEPGMGQEKERLEASIKELRRLVGVGHCVLVGKGWGAQLSVELVASGRLGTAVSGVVLIAPGEINDAATKRIDTAAFLIWARDDEEAEFRDCAEWADAMRRWKAPSLIREVKEGGHNLAKILEKEHGVAPSMLHFVSACLLAADLMSLASSIDEGDDDDDEVVLPDRAARLAEELPTYLIGYLGGSDDDEETGVAAALAKQAASGRYASKNIRTAAKKLQEWMDNGMKQLASATE